MAYATGRNIRTRQVPEMEGPALSVMDDRALEFDALAIAVQRARQRLDFEAQHGPVKVYTRAEIEAYERDKRRERFLKMGADQVTR